VAEGFVLVDKPSGWTSHDVVAKLRGIFGVKAGHAGTLDPLATGLLIVGLGRATRLLRFLQETMKGYRARAVFGVATDTLDSDGAILAREVMAFDEDELKRVAKRFVGTISQVPPMVSAVKVGGRRLYSLARKGIEVEREARNVEVYSLKIDEFAPGAYPEASFSVECGSGTYVRSLADDMARALGGHAHLTELRRERIGPHSVEDAWTVEALESGDAGDAVVTPADGLAHIPAVGVEGASAESVRHGAPIRVPEASKGLVRIIAEGRLLAVYNSNGRLAKPEVVLS
jgi:tRNA pseudouridine55 synthase